MLTGNLNLLSGTGITIDADNATLDLNGFRIFQASANPAAGAAVSVTGAHTNITIRNGSIQGGTGYNGSSFTGNGFASGISAPDAKSIRVENVSIVKIRGAGIDLGAQPGTLVRGCLVDTVAGRGVYALTIVDSSAKTCGNDAIYAPRGVVTGCIGECTAADDGITAESVANSTGDSNNGRGIVGASVGNSQGGVGISGTTAAGCRGFSISGAGISAKLVSHCFGSSATGNGIVATIAVASSSSNGNSAINNKYLMP